MHRAFVSRCVTQRSSTHQLVASASRGAYCRPLPQIPGLRSTEVRSNPRRSFGRAAIMAEAGSSETAANSNGDDVVVQYVVLRRDLWKELDWPLGSVVAQACHAATAVLWQCRDDDVVNAYCAPENLDSMHKVRHCHKSSLSQLALHQSSAHRLHSINDSMQQPMTCICALPGCPRDQGRDAAAQFERQARRGGGAAQALDRAARGLPYLHSHQAIPQVGSLFVLQKAAAVQGEMIPGRPQ